MLYLLATVISNLSITCFTDRTFSSSVLQAILNGDFFAIFSSGIIVGVLGTAVSVGEVSVHGGIADLASIGLSRDVKAIIN